MFRLYLQLVITLCLLACPVQAGMVIGSGAAGGSNCTQAYYKPSADQTIGNWSIDSGVTDYAPLAAWVSWPADDARYLYQNNNTTAADVVRATLPGDCNITSITIAIMSSSASATPRTIVIDISPDNATWTATQNFTTGTSYTPTEASHAFSVSWSTPAYCYVRFHSGGDGADTNYFYGLRVQTN